MIESLRKPETAIPAIRSDPRSNPIGRPAELLRAQVLKFLWQLLNQIESNIWA